MTDREWLARREFYQSKTYKCPYGTGSTFDQLWPKEQERRMNVADRLLSAGVTLPKRY